MKGPFISAQDPNAPLPGETPHDHAARIVRQTEEAFALGRTQMPGKRKLLPEVSTGQQTQGGGDPYAQLDNSQGKHDIGGPQHG